MRIGVPREVKNHEYRVALTPAGVRALTVRGHEVLVQKDAGVGSGLADELYERAGARIVPDAATAWGEADMVMKVKEPIASEYQHLRPDLMLFTYLHLAADGELTRQLVANKVTAIAYETVEMPGGQLPLLAPMSEVAGRLSTQVGAATLMKAAGGGGVLLGGVPGVAPGRVVVIGGGVAGYHAATMAVGLGAEVTILDTNVARLRQLDQVFGGRVRLVASSQWALEHEVAVADLVVGAVLVSGARAPKLVSNEMVASMKPGAVLVDIAVDQGGCFEDTHATTHADPTFEVHDAVFYCVANMPGAVPQTSTHALTNVTLPYAAALADTGWRDALRTDPALVPGLNVAEGSVTCEPVAVAHGMPSVPAADMLAS